MKRVGQTAMLVLGMTLMHQPAWAARTKLHEAAESPSYGRKAGGMIGRGLLNAATCFVDILVNVVNETKAGPPFVGTLTGIAKGAGCGVLRLGSGIIDVATFWVPGFNGAPVSDSYENCLAPGSVSAASMGESWPATTPSSAQMGYPETPSTATQTWQTPSASTSTIGESTAPLATSETDTSVVRKRQWKK